MERKGDEFGVECSNFDEDFQEEKVWGSHYISTHESHSFGNSESSSSSTAWGPTTAPKTTTTKNGNILCNNEGTMVQSSAPLAIPDWSKIVGKNENIKHDGNVNVEVDEEEEDDDDDDDDDDGEVVPPHEWMARKLARSQASSFSVMEGRGRKLRGRDLRKVRNEVLTKTGFIES